jgi:release factor glutamine methyltransferase
LAVASRVPWAEVILTDISPEALCLAERNAAALGAKARCVAADVLKTPPPDLGRFDMIVCNPPYISDEEYHALDIGVRGYEPETALRGGADGLDFYRSVIPQWRGAVSPGGALLFEVGLGQAAAVAEMMRSGGYLRVSAERDLSGIERVVMGHKAQ